MLTGSPVGQTIATHTLAAARTLSATLWKAMRLAEGFEVGDEAWFTSFSFLAAAPTRRAAWIS